MDYNKVVAFVYKANNIIKYLKLNPTLKNGNPNDFVTAVDIGISDFLKEELYNEFPDVAFMTEEEKEHFLGGKTFILDPIDGTTNLVYDYQMSSISLAYVEDKQVKFGVVFNPFTNELFFGIKGQGAYLFKTNKGISSLLKTGIENYKGKPLKVSKRDLPQSLIEFGAGSSHKDQADQNFERAKRIFKNCLDIRRTCSTALAICYIATGRLDGYFEKVIQPWDFAAGILILDEAGGTSGTWSASPLPLSHTTDLICSNAIIFEKLRNLVIGEN